MNTFKKDLYLYLNIFFPKVFKYFEKSISVFDLKNFLKVFIIQHRIQRCNSIDDSINFLRISIWKSTKSIIRCIVGALYFLGSPPTSRYYFSIKIPMVAQWYYILFMLYFFFSWHFQSRRIRTLLDGRMGGDSGGKPCKNDAFIRFNGRKTSAGRRNNRCTVPRGGRVSGSGFTDN